MLRRQVSNQTTASNSSLCRAILLRPSNRYISQRKRIRRAAQGSVQPPGEIAYEDVNVEDLEPLPLMDQNIVPGQGDDSAGSDDVSAATQKREEEAWTRREGYSKGDNKELLIKQLPERQLDLGEVYVLDYEQDSHTTPKMTGVIVKGATNYQVIPVETFISGDAFEGVEEKHELQHLILVKVLSEDPHKLDFTHTYCFNCSAEELYRVSYVPVRDPATIEEPVLRFQPENNFFILDSKDTMPSPMLINLKHEAEDLGVDFNVDLYSGLEPPEGSGKARKRDDEDDGSDSDTVYLTPEPEDPSKSGHAWTLEKGAGAQSEQAKGRSAGKDGLPAADVVASMMQGGGEGERASGRAAMEAAVAEEASAGEETSNLTTGTEIDTDDTPDVPAVDLA